MVTPLRDKPATCTNAIAAARVAFVGAGPGDPGLLTVRAVEMLSTADAVIVDALTSHDIVAAYAKPGTPIINVSVMDTTSGVGEPTSRARQVIQAAHDVSPKEGNQPLIVRALGGCTTTFSGLTDEIVACSREGIDVEVVPGVSAMHAVPAYAGVPLTSRESPAMMAISGDADGVDWAAAASTSLTVVVMGSSAQIGENLTRLLDAGRLLDTPLALTEQGTTLSQKTHVTTLGEAVKRLRSGVFGAPTLAVVGSTVELREELSWFESKPLFGWRVLIPRTKEQSEGMTSHLSRYGATGEIVPTISVEPPRTPQQMQRAIKGLVTGRYEWVGFTSVNAVRAVREKLDELGLDARAFAGLKIAAVGGVTADALREWGIEPDLMPSEEQSAAGLLAEWPPYDNVLDPINGVFLPRADIATDVLVAGLQEMGWEVDDVTAYRTVRASPPPAPIRESIKRGEFDAVVFTSSSTVRNLVGIAGKPHASTVVACIGPATAKTAEEHGLTVSVQASEPSAFALIDALAAFARERARAAIAAGEPVNRPSQRTRRRKSIPKTPA